MWQWRNADDFERDSKLTFYSVLFKQHVCIVQAEVVDTALQMVQVNLMGEKDGRGRLLLSFS